MRPWMRWEHQELGIASMERVTERVAHKCEGTYGGKLSLDAFGGAHHRLIGDVLLLLKQRRLSLPAKSYLQNY